MAERTYSSSSSNNCKNQRAALRIGSIHAYTYRRSNPKKVKERKDDDENITFSSSSQSDNYKIKVSRSAMSDLSNLSSTNALSEFHRDIALTPHPARQSAGAETEYSNRSAPRTKSEKQEQVVKAATMQAGKKQDENTSTAKPSRRNDQRMTNGAPAKSSELEEFQARFVLQFKKSHLNRILTAMAEDSDDTLVNLIVKRSQLKPYEEYQHEKELRRRTCVQST